MTVLGKPCLLASPGLPGEVSRSDGGGLWTPPKAYTLKVTTTNTTLKPLCPNCGYELTGLISHETAASCPECNTSSTYAEAIKHNRRFPSIQKSLILLFIVPQAFHIISYISYLNWNGVDEDALFANGFTPVVLMFWYLLVVTAILISVERESFTSKARARTCRNGWASYLTILFCEVITMAVNLKIFGLWAAAIASV